MQIKEIMTTPVDVCAPDTTLAQAAQEMKKRDTGFLPVGDDKSLLGMVTDRDIVVRGIADAKDPERTTVCEVMSKGVLYLFEDQSVEEAAENMAKNAVRRMPVVNREKLLTGVISLGDIAGRGRLEGKAGEALEEIFKAA